MPNIIVTPERKLFYLEDVQAGASNSEANANKVAATNNFINTRITKQLHFGLGGGNLSGLSGYPYYFSDNSETCVENLLIQRIMVSNLVSGISGNTEFYLQIKRFAGGGWTNMFSINCEISNTAADDIVFSSTDVSAPSGVVLPVLDTDMENLLLGDRIRFVLVSGATNASNLLVTLEVSPV